MSLLPDYLENETVEAYRVRNNLPRVYTPFFPYPEYGRKTDTLIGSGSGQVQWQLDLQAKYPPIIIYPYERLVVSKAGEAVFILFENESQITQIARERIKLCCSDYGLEHAEKSVLSVPDLLARYLFIRHSERNGR